MSVYNVKIITLYKLKRIIIFLNTCVSVCSANLRNECTDFLVYMITQTRALTYIHT